MAGKMYVGDVGTVIYVDCGVSIATATDVRLKIKKPDRTEHEWIGTIYNDKFIKYVIVSGDFDQKGKYYVQAHVQTPTWLGSGETTTFTVYDEYK